jgi:uncharacterized membrane protein
MTDPVTEQTAQRPDQRMDEIMGRLLRTGVVLSAILVFAGGALYVLRHPTPVTDYRAFQGTPAESRNLRGILHEALELHGRGLIQLGLIVLIATPIARVVFSVFAFLYQRDWTYVVVTLVVLALLTYSLFGHHS